MASTEFFPLFYLLHNSTPPLLVVNVYPLYWTFPEKKVGKVGMPNSCGRPCQSSIPLPRIITHILLLIQSLEVVKDVIGCLGGTDEESSS